MKLKRTMLRLLLFFSLLPVCIFGIVSIYETNRKIDDMTQYNLEAVSPESDCQYPEFCKRPQERNGNGGELSADEGCGKV